MKAWNLFLLLLVAALFIWSMSREGFQDTIALHGPPYGDTDCPIVFAMLPSTLVKALETANNAHAPVMPSATDAVTARRYAADVLDYQRKLVSGVIFDVMTDFHGSVYLPATTPLTAGDVDTFLTSHAKTGFLLAHKADIKSLLVAYFVTQTPGAANAPLTAAQLASAGEAAASGYAATFADVGQTPGYSSSGTGGGTGGGTGAAPAPTCPTGYTLSADKKTCNGATATDTKTPTCASGYTYAAGACTLTSTTGGSSTFLTSNSGGNKGNLWGPAFTGMGDNAGPGVAGAPRDYPTLIGPKPKESTMVEGAGIANPSQHQTLTSSGGLPSASGTGSDPNSQFFGSSRVPGDRDLFPNPYTQFTPSTGSSKTEPVPFLSDFSAFFR